MNELQTSVALPYEKRAQVEQANTSSKGKRSPAGTLPEDIFASPCCRYTVRLTIVLFPVLFLRAMNIYNCTFTKPSFDASDWFPWDLSFKVLWMVLKNPVIQKGLGCISYLKHLTLRKHYLKQISKIISLRQFCIQDFRKMLWTGLIPNV